MLRTFFRAEKVKYGWISRRRLQEYGAGERGLFQPRITNLPSVQQELI